MKKFLSYFIIVGSISLGFSQVSGYVYRNDYDDALLNPESFEGDSRKTYLNNGDFVYELLDQKFAFASFEHVSINLEKEFTIETEMQAAFTNIKEGMFGLQWGHQSVSSVNTFVINEKNEYRISQSNKGDVMWLTEWTPTGLTAVEFTSKIKFAVHQTKDICQYFLNGKKIFEGYPLKFFGDGIGYLIKADQLRCSYLYVKQNNGNINLSSKPLKTPGKEHLETGMAKICNEINPMTNKDGKTIYFTRVSKNRNMDVELNRTVMKAELDDNKNPKNITELEMHYPNHKNELLSSITNENNFIFSSVSAESKTDCNRSVYGFKLQGDQFNSPNKIFEGREEDSLGISKATFSKDRKTMIFSANKILNGVLQSDLFVVTKISDSAWTAPQSLGVEINSFGSEDCPFLFYDDKTLYFSSTGHAGYGRADVFVSHRLENSWTKWSKPENLGPVVNGKGWDGYFFIPQNGEYAFMSSTFEFYNNLDLFKVQLEVKKEWVLHGKVLSQKTDLPLADAKVKAINIVTKKICDSTVVGKSGEYRFTKLKPGEYFVEADAGILHHAITVVIHENQPDLNYNIIISTPEAGQMMTLHNISFDPNKFELLSSSFEELDKLAKLMKESADIKIEIHGHTSMNREGEKFNLDLSTKRALAVKSYLISKGIKAARIVHKGFGFNEPIYTGEDEAEQSKNRRVEIIFLK